MIFTTSSVRGIFAMLPVPAATVALFVVIPALGDVPDGDGFHTADPIGGGMRHPPPLAATIVVGDTRCGAGMESVSPPHDLQKIACVRPDTVIVLAGRGWIRTGGGQNDAHDMIPLGAAAANNELAAGMYGPVVHAIATQIYSWTKIF